MTKLESALRAAQRRDPVAFRSAMASMGILGAMDAQPRSRFAAALKKRFGGDPRRLLAAIGMDEGMLEDLNGRPPSRTMRDDKDMIGNIRQMENMPRSERMAIEEHAQHGHGRDDEMDGMSWDDWESKAREMMSASGMSEDDQNAVFEMLPSRTPVDGERYQRTTLDEEEIDREETQQNRLERSEKQVASPHRREDAEARRREDRDSLQRDSMPRNARNGGMGGRFSGAHDSDMQFIDELIARQPEVYTGGSSANQRAEAAADARVAEIRKLAGVGSGMGMDAGQARSRSERILAVTMQEQARRQRAEDSFARDFPEAARVRIQP
jgi:hypothetical protein